MGTATVGALLFRKWLTGERPHLPGDSARGHRRAEDRRPSPAVYLHGLAALTTAGLVVSLLILD